jgi:hypothetical protein
MGERLGMLSQRVRRIQVPQGKDLTEFHAWKHPSNVEGIFAWLSGYLDATPAPVSAPPYYKEEGAKMAKLSAQTEDDSPMLPTHEPAGQIQLDLFENLPVQSVRRKHYYDYSG